DFVPFDFDLDDDGLADGGRSKEKKREREEHVREWDMGKRKAADSPGKKRKVEEYDQDDGYANKRERTNAACRRAPWVHDVDWDSCNNVAEMYVMLILLHREVEAFNRYIAPTRVEDEVRGMIIEIVRKEITKQFPDAKVHPFGSYETKLYLPLGDIDLVVQSDSIANWDKVSVLNVLASTMKRSGITDRVTIIAKAKVPIIKFITTHGRFSVDISINQANGLPVVKMISQFLRALPALKPLVMIIKTFLHQRSMNEVFTGGLGSYSLVCMVISFLQMHPKIRRGEIDPSKNLGVLVMEFFELYGCYFNYHEVGISLRDGGTYFPKATRGWLDYNRSQLLSIEDPADPSNDISKGSYGINRVKTTLAGAHGIMRAQAYLRAGMISSRKENRTVRLHDNVDPEEMSILSSVLGVTQETVNHRRLVQEVFDKGVLHRMLGISPNAPLKSDLHVSRSPSPPAKRKSPPRSLLSRIHESASVTSAWGEADMEVSAASDGSVGEEEGQESRYDIDKRQPPRKRRRTGTARDAHTTYFTTDEED
ncbi:Nucleotidyltransferase, partial [Heliocybe sulcata]